MNRTSLNEAELPLVSVGIPTYNRPELLARTLGRVASQTYKNLEIIVSDNASDGRGTSDVVNSFKKNDSRIRFYRQPSNLGAMVNFYFVLEKATGGYFMWAADDDYFDDENLIEALFSAIAGVKRMAFPNVNIIAPNELENQPRCLTGTFSSARSREEYLTAWCKHGSGYPVYGLFNLAKVTKQELLQAFDPGLKCYGEGIFLHKLFLSGEVTYVDSVCLNYSRSANASSLAPAQLLVDFVSYTRDVLRLYLEAPLDEGFRKQLMQILIDVHWPYLRSLADQAIAKAAPAG